MGILQDMLNDRASHARIIARLLMDGAGADDYLVRLHLAEFKRLESAIADRVAREAGLT